jgi:hypothetical protein
MNNTSSLVENLTALLSLLVRRDTQFELSRGDFCLEYIVLSCRQKVVKGDGGDGHLEPTRLSRIRKARKESINKAISKDKSAFP